MIIIKGKQAVREALEAEAGIDRIVVSHTVAEQRDIRHLVSVAKRTQVKVQVVSAKELDRQFSDGHHQGIIAYVSPVKHGSIEALIEAKEAHPVVMALDHIEDPHNLGAILRTCEFFGIKTVIYPKDRSSQLSPGVIKAASGAVYHMNLIKVTNLGRSLDQLAEAGYWIYASHVEQGLSLEEFTPNFPLVFVMGNEHKGVSSLTVKLANECVYIPSYGKISSLNVSVATGIFCQHIAHHLGGA